MTTPWDEEVPEDWDMIPLKYLTKSMTGGTPKKSNDELWGGEIPWVSSKDMKSGLVEETEDYITKKAVKKGSTKLVPEGSLLMVSRSGILEHSIPVAVAGTELAINQDIRAYIPQRGAPSANYLRNTILSFENDLLDLWRQQGATVQSLNSEAVSQTEFPIPPAEKQKEIDDYCEVISNNIGEMRGKIEDLVSELEDKRHSIITHSVINSDGSGEIKSSPTDALENTIPEHWRIGKLRWVTNKIGSGSTPSGGSEAYVEEGVPFIRSQNVTERGLVLDDVVYIDEATHQEMSSTHLHKGDVLLNITGASLGRTSVVPEELPSGNVNQHVCILRPVYHHITSEYLNYVMLSGVGQEQIFANQTGASRQAVTFSQIGDFVVPLPPMSEQQEITRVLNSEISKIHTSIDKLRELSNLLEEQNKVLTAKAVTGQTKSKLKKSMAR